MEINFDRSPNRPVWHSKIRVRDGTCFVEMKHHGNDRECFLILGAGEHDLVIPD